MTRINVIPSAELTDAHLFAEIRELPRVWNMNRVGWISSAYCLGTGHVSFFRDKRRWLAARHAELVTEWLGRGFNLSAESRRPLPLTPFDRESWTPTPEAILLNLNRLRERLLANPSAHRYGGEPVPLDFYGA